MVPVEDFVIRQHRLRCNECTSAFESFLKRHFQVPNAILRIGLGRPYKGGSGPVGCYLQVNHIFPLPPRLGHFSAEREAQ